MRVRLVILCSIFMSFDGLVSYESSYAQSAWVNADPDFDGFYNSGDGTSGAWKPFKISNPGPVIWKHPTEGYPQGPSLWIYGDNMQFDGGVYQVVAVTPGRGYHFDVAWAVVRHGGVLVRDDVNLVRQVGIDPTGGTNPLSPNVQWSGEYRGTGKFPPELAIDQFALGDHISIFIRAKNFYTDSRNEVFFDHAVLTDNGAAPIAVTSPTRPPATPTATKPTTPTPVRTRVALAATSAPTLAPTFTPLPTNTAPSTTAIRTPRATATPEPIAPAASDFSYTAILLVAGICLLGGGVIVVLGLAILFFKIRSSQG
jgi:hypothetical protein